jgi:hypothetical protein
MGILLSRYRSGSLPKAFKIIPSLPIWARILAITRPDSWSPQAMRAATRILVSNLKPAQCKVYLEGVLLPAVRNDIAEHGKLNVHYWESLKKGLYKPAAFFKGVLFPMCEGGCTLKEASILASVISRVSIPILHSAAALLRLSRMNYSGTSWKQWESGNEPLTYLMQAPTPYSFASSLTRNMLYHIRWSMDSPNISLYYQIPTREGETTASVRSCQFCGINPCWFSHSGIF